MHFPKGLHILDLISLKTLQVVRADITKLQGDLGTGPWSQRNSTEQLATFLVLIFTLCHEITVDPGDAGSGGGTFPHQWSTGFGMTSVTDCRDPTMLLEAHKPQTPQSPWLQQSYPLVACLLSHP